MSDLLPEPFGHNFPLWHVVDRKLWLAGGAATMLIEVAEVGHVPVFFTDEHQAIEFLDDADKPCWCTILVRDKSEFLHLLTPLKNTPVTHAAFDFAYPGGPHDRTGWVIPIAHIIEQINRAK